MSRVSKLIVILGPTATGKTKLAVALARKFKGEIISADSRQVYQGMDIGTGKDLKEYGSVPYHLIDVVKPKTEFNVAKYKKLALKAIYKIIERGKLPILVGGTGLYLSAIIENYDLPKIKPNKEVGKSLTSLTSLKKIKLLKKLDPEALKFVDIKNPRRVDRALEVCLAGQKFSALRKKNSPLFDVLQIGITFPKNILDARIDKRVDARIKQDMVQEVAKLHKNGVPWTRLEGFGLEYRLIARYLQGKIKKDEMIHLLKIAIHQFAKRQMTWFKRDKKIYWLKTNKNKNQIKEAERLIKRFMI